MSTTTAATKARFQPNTVSPGKERGSGGPSGSGGGGGGGGGASASSSKTAGKISYLAKCYECFAIDR